MSSEGEDFNEDNTSGLPQNQKKRRIQRACDICRRKKIRCDGVQMPGNRCSNCILCSFDCTYVEAAKKRGPTKGYVEILERRVEMLEEVLRRLCPDQNILTELHIATDRESQSPDAAVKAEQVCSSASLPRSVNVATSIISRIGEPGADQKEEVFVDSTLIETLKKLDIDRSSDKIEERFFGKSSGPSLIQTAMELKSEYVSSDNFKAPPSMSLDHKRPEFWGTQPWEKCVGGADNPSIPFESFPDRDLMEQLVDAFFLHLNLYQAVLHRPTFERSVAENLHLDNTGFACTLLLVCAIGSRFSEDPRVFLEGHDSLHSRGWKWFQQVQTVRSLLVSPSLYDMQFYCLSVMFLKDSSAPQSCWSMVGIGIRLAQEVGAHRRKAQDHVMTVEDELWKRAFWFLVCLDRAFSTALGRPCAIQDEDFDLDMPIECDDEYWEHPDPSQRFKQPANKPSLISYFILDIKLHQIASFALRTIYSINKSKSLLGLVGPQWEKHIVAELDSALNKWVDSVPNHLRWDPNREDDRFLKQSIVLYATYYHIQILVHRPFIPSKNHPSPSPFPSLAICTNAARSCSHVVDILQKRNFIPPPLLQLPAFTSGIVLLVGIWGGKRSGLSIDPNKEMLSAYKCMRMLRKSEDRWHSAGRLWDILNELAYIGDLPLPQPSPPANKRERDSEVPMASLSSPKDDSPSPSDVSRNISGLQRVTRYVPIPMRHLPLPQETRSAAQEGQPQTQDQLPLLPPPSQAHRPLHAQRSLDNLQPPQPSECYRLPTYGNEFATLPPHGDFSMTEQSPLDYQSHSYWYPPTELASGSGTTNTNVTPPITGNSDTCSSSSTFSYRHPVVTETKFSTQGYGVIGGGAGSLMDTTGSSAMYNLSAPHNYYPGAPDSDTDSYIASTRSNGNSYAGSSSPSGGSYAAPAISSTPSHAASALAVNSMRMYRGQSSGGGGMVYAPQSSHLRLVDKYAEQRQTPYIDPDLMSTWSTVPTGFALEDWGSYLSNIGELATQHPQGHIIHG
ncbi:uncharacterized protein LACBIDRAFT_296682 [Laccaria bicolor S238N-H82]|uniref:Predicted protein n=1 Tax=Laccaria bicolor (strain S238N-H82 / ATCC MYA-4686) TaxID=486041 RepID=B0D9E9_LACBS|nr:uncharacterized protein LACBIDRAFT_296682 [Laccaria bicolor S238N-H82]EDR09003.1 predicted protein [Laccaria bicolor S238N-H82]|eukprot:XP_001880316.1 predicted protein [Laccaria bicolor S238N-H82]